MARGKWFVTVLAIGFLAATAGAASQTGSFWAGLGPEGLLPEQRLHSESGGDGYGDGEWFYYPNDPAGPGGAQPAQQPVPGWWNQWWYDDPFDWNRYKKVTLDFDAWVMNPQDPNGGLLDVWINYTLPTWQSGPPPGGAPPTVDMPPGTYIGRLFLGSIPVNSPVPTPFHQAYDLRNYGIDYNPEWISVDIMGFNVWMSEPPGGWVDPAGGGIQGVGPGTIEHECLADDIPEPMTMLIVGVGFASLAGYVRRRRRTS